MFSAKNLAKIGLIAAIYAVVTIALAPISYGAVQVRVSEALTVLPFISPLAIPGLFIGCLVANFYSAAGIYDVIFGSLATLIAALITWKMPSPKLAPLQPVITNGLVIGTMLSVLFDLPLVATIIYVALGELVACYALGYPLLVWLEKRPDLKRLFSL